MVHQFVRHLRGAPLDVEAPFNLTAGEYVVLPVAAWCDDLFDGLLSPGRRIQKIRRLIFFGERNLQ
ncbi:MAG: hypothetical protein QM775_28745 [Pirellulales bacterium]